MWATAHSGGEGLTGLPGRAALSGSPWAMAPAGAHFLPNKSQVWQCSGGLNTSLIERKAPWKDSRDQFKLPLIDGTSVIPQVLKLHHQKSTANVFAHI